jgi:ATP-dependent DNA helicase RecG
LHLLKTDDDDVFRPTVSGVLLCTERPDQRLPSAYVQAVCYSGSIQDSAYQLDAEDIHGPLDLQIRRALAFVLKNQRVAAVKDPAREERPQFSKRALFEAIVNAVVHRDYSIPTARIRLFLFSDRLEIRSPGTIPNSMTLESMRELSLPRNEVIANLMARFYTVDDATLVRRTVMDKRGDGVRVILAESERLSGKRPDYVLIGDMEVKLTLYAAAFRTEY